MSTSPILALKTPFCPPPKCYFGPQKWYFRPKRVISHPAQGFPSQGFHTKAATAVAVRMHRSQQCAAQLASKKPDIFFAPMPQTPFVSSLYSCAQRMPQLRRICVAPPSYRARHHEGGQKAWRLVTGKSGVALGLSPSAQVLDPHYVCPPHPHYLCPPHPALNILDSIYLSVPAPQPLWT